MHIIKNVKENMKDCTVKEHLIWMSQPVLKSKNVLVPSSLIPDLPE